MRAILVLFVTIAAVACTNKSEKPKDQAPIQPATEIPHKGNVACPNLQTGVYASEDGTLKYLAIGMNLSGNYTLHLSSEDEKGLEVNGIRQKTKDEKSDAFAGCENGAIRYSIGGKSKYEGTISVQDGIVTVNNISTKSILKMKRVGDFELVTEVAADCKNYAGTYAVEGSELKTVKFTQEESFVMVDFTWADGKTETFSTKEYTEEEEGVTNAFCVNKKYINVNKDVEVSEGNIETYVYRLSLPIAEPETLMISASLDNKPVQKDGKDVPPLKAKLVK